MEGSFNPSTARTYLTKIAKTGGMKALLATVGSVIPGFGTIAGFVTGTVIDVMYGKNIDKFIDKAIDAFQDKKVYVFTCPNCGRSWTRKYDTIDEEVDNELDDEEDDSLTEVVDDRIAEIESYFTEAKKHHILFNQFRENAYHGLALAQATCEACIELAEEIEDEDVEAELLSGVNWIERQVSDLLGHITYYCKGSQDTEFDVEDGNEAKPLSIRVHGAYPIFYQDNIMLVGDIRTGRVSPDTRIILPDGIETKVERIYMFDRELDSAEAGDVCALIIPLNGVDSNGEEVSLEFPDGIFEITGAVVPGNIPLSIELNSEEEEYLTEYKACLEDDGVITDRERRLLDRIRKSLGISEERARELEESCSAPSFTEEEQEYADEIRACLEEDGRISDRERRLLNKIRASLGISEERAKEIEAMVK